MLQIANDIAGGLKIEHFSCTLIIVGPQNRQKEKLIEMWFKDLITFAVNGSFLDHNEVKKSN